MLSPTIYELWSNVYQLWFLGQNQMCYYTLSLIQLLWPCYRSNQTLYIHTNCIYSIWNFRWWDRLRYYKYVWNSNLKIIIDWFKNIWIINIFIVFNFIIISIYLILLKLILKDEIETGPIPNRWVQKKIGTKNGNENWTVCTGSVPISGREYRN